MYQGTIINVMVGSPGDVIDLVRKAIECIQNWNILHSADKKIALIPHNWTTSTYPSVRKPAQQHIDDLLISNSDAMVAIFGSRIGTRTDNYCSGTVEEIEIHRKLGKPVMVFFSENYDESQDIDQLKSLQDYRNKFHGLYEVFNGVEDFEKKFISKLQLCIQNEIIPLVQDLSTQNIENKQVDYSDEEFDILREWCNSNTDFGWCSVSNNCKIFRFGNLQIKPDNLYETVKYEDMYSKFLSNGHITESGFTPSGLKKYRLTSKAFELLGIR